MQSLSVDLMDVSPGVEAAVAVKQSLVASLMPSKVLRSLFESLQRDSAGVSAVGAWT
jgi:hypothetical protein